MTQEKTKVYRARSGNSYILLSSDKELHYIYFPFLSIQGINGTLPFNYDFSLDIYLGEIVITDGKLPIEELVALTGGK